LKLGAQYSSRAWWKSRVSVYPRFAIGPRSSACEKDRFRPFPVVRGKIVHRRTETQTECPGKNRKRGQQKFVTAEDVLPVVADTDITGTPQEYFVCPTSHSSRPGIMLV
jgi:hypothetical protein